MGQYPQLRELTVLYPTRLDTVETYPSVMALWLMPRIPKFLDSNPSISINFKAAEASSEYFLRAPTQYKKRILC